MFVPNNHCRIKINSGVTDIYGQPVETLTWIVEPCSIVRMQLTGKKSSVRADSSASRGNAMELQADLKILVAARSRAGINDVLEIGGYEFRVLGKEPRFSVMGALDHYEILANIWSAE